MLGSKLEYADFITINTAMRLHEKGVAIVVTDGKYVQLDEDEK